MCLKYTPQWLDTHLHRERIPPTEVINTSIPAQSPFEKNLWLEHVSSTLSEFQSHGTVLATLFSMFYFRSWDLIHLIMEMWYHFTNLSLFPLPPQPWQPPINSLFLWIQQFFPLFFFNIPHISDTMQYLSFSAWFISLSLNALQTHLHYCKWQSFLLFSLRLNHTPIASPCVLVGD